MIRQDVYYDEEIAAALDPICRKVLRQHYLNWLLRGLVAGFMLAVLLRLSSFLFPWEAAGCIAAVITGMPVLALLLGWSRRPGIYQVACMVDEKGLKERVSTALELSGVESEMIRRQRDDALKHLRIFDGERHFAVKLPRREGRILLSSLLITALLLYLPNPQQPELDKRTAVKKEIAVQQKKIEEVKKELKKAEQMRQSIPRKKAIASLEELQKDLGEAEDLKEALRAISRAETNLGQLQAAEQKTEAERSGRSLASAGNGNVTQANLNANNGSSRPVSSNSLRPGQAGGSTGINSGLNQASQAVEDSRAALLAAAGSPSSGAGSGKGPGGQENSGGEGSLASTSASSPANTGNGSETSASGGSGDASGNGGQSGSGNSSGSGNNNNNASGSGSGAGRGTANGSQSSGQMNTSMTSSGGNGFPDMNYREYEKIYDPERIGIEGNESLVQGKAGKGPEQKLQTDDPAVMNDARRPYREVLAQYSQAARDSLGRNPIPADMSDVVRDYFSSLEE